MSKGYFFEMYELESSVTFVLSTVFIWCKDLACPVLCWWRGTMTASQLYSLSGSYGQIQLQEEKPCCRSASVSCT